MSQLDSREVKFRVLGKSVLVVLNLSIGIDGNLGHILCVVWCDNQTIIYSHLEIQGKFNKSYFYFALSLVKITRVHRGCSTQTVAVPGGM